MNRERRVGRRSVVHNLVKLSPENDNEEKKSKGPKKALFDDDDKSFIMRRNLKPLHEINNYQLSSSKSKSHEKLYGDNFYETSGSTFMEMFNKHNKIPLSPPSKVGRLESSMVKKRKEPNEPILQSKELYSALIDSPCTKFGKAQFSNALSSASKFLLNRHLESVKTNADLFYEETPKKNLPSSNKNHLNESKAPNLMDLSITPKKESFQTDCFTQTSIPSTALLVEEIEELKKSEVENIRQTKLHCCNLIKSRFREIELEIEKNFGVIENKITENYDKLVNKIQDGKNDSSESKISADTTIETVKEKNYTRMTGAFGILNNLNYDCSFLKTPKTKGKTREEMLNQGTLTPCTMSFVLQEQLMHLNSDS